MQKAQQELIDLGQVHDFFINNNHSKHKLETQLNDYQQLNDY